MSKRFFPFALVADQPPRGQNPAFAFAANATAGEADVAQTAFAPKPIEQQLADSFNANNAIFTYVVAMQNTKLPPVSGDWYKTFQGAFHDAAAHASAWSTYSAALVGVPTGIANFGEAFRMNMETINTYANIVKQDPSKTAALNSLISSIQSLLTSVQSQKTAASAVVPKLDEFAAHLTADQAVMQQAIASAMTQQGVDKDAVARLKADIAALKADVAKWNTVITAVGIAGGISIFLGCVVAIFSLGLGVAIAVAATAATITTIVIGSEKIKADYSTILADEAQIGTLNTQIAALSTLEADLGDLIKLSGAAQEQLHLIQQAWTQLETEIQAVITDLQNAKGHTNPLEIDGVIADLNAANADWQTLVQYCNVLKNINYTILPAEKLAA